MTHMLITRKRLGFKPEAQLMLW